MSDARPLRRPHTGVLRNRLGITIRGAGRRGARADRAQRLPAQPAQARGPLRPRSPAVVPPGDLRGPLLVGGRDQDRGDRPVNPSRSHSTSCVLRRGLARLRRERHLRQRPFGSSSRLALYLARSRRAPFREGNGGRSAPSSPSWRGTPAGGSTGGDGRRANVAPPRPACAATRVRWSPCSPAGRARDRPASFDVVVAP